MKYNFNGIVFLVLVLVMGFSSARSSEMKNVESLSLIEVIANSDKYHDKKIRVIGFLNVEFESQAIYLSSSDYDNSITKNALWVSFDDRSKYKEFNKQYVLIEGIFNAKDKGHLKMYSGSMEHINRVILWSEKTE